VPKISATPNQPDESKNSLTYRTAGITSDAISQATNQFNPRYLRMKPVAKAAPRTARKIRKLKAP
jgi:hypothetical protein